MGKFIIEKADELAKPPALVCYQECEVIRKAALEKKKPKAFKPIKKYEDMSGTVKIVVVNPRPCKDCCERCWSAVLSVATMLVAITSFAVLVFAAGAYAADIDTHLEKYHIPMCTIGFVLFSALGIMSINSVYGPSAQMKRPGRVVDHCLILFFGLAMAVGGGTLCILYIPKMNYLEAHTITGLVSFVLGVISLFTGIPAAVSKRRKCLIVSKVMHAITGMLAFLCYMACFILALLKPVFRVWARDVVSHYYLVLITLVVIFTIIILSVPCIKCMKNNRKCRKIHKKKCTRGQTKAYIIAEKQKQEYLKEIEEERAEAEAMREINELTYQKGYRSDYVI